MGDVTVGVEQLREEIGRKCFQVIDHQDAEFHFHTGHRAAVNNGYLDEWLEGLPQEAVDSHAGVANPFHWGLPESGELASPRPLSQGAFPRTLPPNASSVHSSRMVPGLTDRTGFRPPNDQANCDGWGR